MMNFFAKLDRMAERLVTTMDDELHAPVVRAVTGEVFTHGTENHRSATIRPAAQVKKTEVSHNAHQLCDAVTETLNPPLSLPAMPKASISTQVT